MLYVFETKDIDGIVDDCRGQIPCLWDGKALIMTCDDYETLDGETKVQLHYLCHKEVATY